MSFLINGGIPEGDLPVSAMGQSDMVRIVREGKSLMSPASALPVPSSITAKIASLETEQDDLSADVAAVEAAQTSIQSRLQTAESGVSANSTAIDTLSASQSSGAKGYATKADLPASATVGDIAMVTNDGTAANNGTYRWSGSAWVMSADRTSQLASDVASIATRGQLLLNRGADFPQRSATFNGTTSAKNTVFADILLDVKVYGARPGKFYAIRYFVNGSTALSGSNPFGWIIHENDAATYETSNEGQVTVSQRTDATTPAFPISGKPETIRINSPYIPGVTVQITVDTSKLPAWGTPVSAGSVAQLGFSWIIDPSCYVMAVGAISGGTKSAAYFEVNESAKAVSASWVHGESHLLRTRWAPNGFNSLFNFLALDRAPSNSPIETASWAQVATNSTDWIPPLTIVADSGDGAPSIYTGGNHGSNGDASGSLTASMTEWRCWIDGEVVQPGTSFSGRAGEVIVRWVNELFASNTITLNRYALRQIVVAKFRDGKIEVSIEHQAIEPLTVRIDNGLQMRADMFEVSVHYLGGSADGRQSASSVTDSGPKSSAPDAWAIACRGSYGDQISWIDRIVGKGDASSVGSTSPLLRRLASGWKFYHAVVTTTAPLHMDGGEKYHYRGGYCWVPSGNVTGDLDVAFLYRKGGRDMIGWAFNGGGSHTGGMASIPVQLVGREFDFTGECISPTGLPLESSGYAAPTAEIK